MRIALVTCRTLPEPDHDAAPLEAALLARGHAPVLLPWDDDEASLAAVDVVLLRSPWNYYRAPEAFLAWLDRTATSAPVLNPPDVVHANVHKGYLEDIERRGIEVVPTRVLRRTEGPHVPEVLAATDWDDVVVKPCISAASWRTRRFRHDQLSAAAAFAAALLAEGDVLLQRFEPGAVDPGERALVWIDGRFTHAVRKRPRLEGQAESVECAEPPTAAEIALGERVLAPLGDRLTYARLDLMPAADGRPLVSEVELIEPSLFLRQHPPALDRLVDALERALSPT